MARRTPALEAARPPFPAALLLALLGPLLALVGGCGAESAAEAGGRAAAPPDGPRRALLWQASLPDAAEVLLLGTMHLSHPAVTTLPPEADAALERADALWTELLSTAEDQRRLAAAGAWDGAADDLYAALSPHVAADLRETLRGLGKPPELLAAVQPWMAEIVLAMFMAEPWMTGGQALDTTLTARARAAGKPVAALETIDEQIAALAVGSFEDQERRLALTLERLAADRAAGRDAMREQVEAYLAGDEDALWALAREQLDDGGATLETWWDAVYVQRNRRMAARIDEAARAAPGAVQLYAVGALHLVGSPSVVELLRERGWTVERVPAPAAGG